MSAERPRKVLLVDDDEGYCDLVVEVAQMLQKGEIVVLHNPQTAIEMSPQLAEMGFTGAAVDGNFTPGELSGREGQAVVNSLRLNDPGKNIRIIGISGNVYLNGIDIHVGKDDVFQLVDYLFGA